MKRVGRQLSFVWLVFLAALVPLGCGGGSKAAGKPDGGGTAPSCRNSLDCTLGLVCDPSIAECVQCVTAADCPTDNDCTTRKCVPFVACTNSLACPTSEVCDTAAGRCVACLTDADCMDMTLTCVADSCRTKCASDRTCTPLGLLCDQTTGSCVRCIVSADCPAGQYCQANTCQMADCQPNQTTCMLNAIATCNTIGDGFVGTAVPCDPKACVQGVSGATCTGSTVDGGAAGGGGAAGSGAASGSGGASGGGGTAGSAGGASNGGATGSGGVPASGGVPGSGGVTSFGGASGTGGAAGVGGGVGSGGSGGTSGASGASCGLVIDDMEADTGLICRGNGRHGHWFSYNDMLTGTTQTPARGIAPILPEQIVPPRGSSNYAMHTTGTISSYGGIGCSLNGSDADVPELPMTYDVSGFTGITFYARGTPSIGVMINSEETVATAYGGTCTASSCYGLSTVIAAQATQWTQYKVAFSQMTPGAEVTNLQHAFFIEFQADGATQFDFWIDDLAFY